jgi:hypothetical protein
MEPDISEVSSITCTMPFQSKVPRFQVPGYKAPAFHMKVQMFKGPKVTSFNEPWIPFFFDDG